ncbi:MAG TPA: hypothetical protein VK886_12645 [Vicinamibacterales bacterium]|nr:hypothetical protein [Vicinamibacterales bacterium]
MDLRFSIDESGRLICDLADGAVLTTATAASVPNAAIAFLHALDSLRENLLGECFWEEHGGTYRWMFCRNGSRVDVAVMWCAGVITGWQHVFRADCDLDVLERARTALQRLGTAAV